MKKLNQKGMAHVVLLLSVMVVVGCIGFAGWQVYRSNREKSSGNSEGAGGAKKAQEYLRDCKGNGPVTLTHQPMDMKDVGSVIPAGSLAGAHVTPIDHLYFYPKDMKNRDAAPVYAMGDGYIVGYQERGVRVDTGQSQKAEYQIYIQHNCSVVSYFDLLTSLDPSIAEKVKGKDLHIPVKAGQEIGRVGAQSLDTAVYNYDLTLKGFVNKESYKTEPVKLHTDDFFKYFKGTQRTEMLAKNLRKVEPYGGKIDYDIDGKLIGNWFVEGTNGYAGEGQKYADGNGRGYWSTHFAVVPDAIDPSINNISFGDYNGQAKQFSAKDGSPDPVKIGSSDGVVKYEMVEYRQNGGNPDGGVMMRSSQIQGTVLLQVTSDKKLKMEAFPNKTSSQVSGFTSAAKTYVR